MIDLNADLGENGLHDEELFPLISSANVACGGHAGDPMTMLRTLRLARRFGARVGAHPGFWDREHFGRRELPLGPEEIFALVLCQIAALDALARHEGMSLEYVKPHGALYHQAHRDRIAARPLVEAARKYALAVMGLPGGGMEQAAKEQGAPFIPEGFADRRYLPDGQLVPRGDPRAIITDPDEAADQVQRLIDRGQVQTICIHGDHPDPVPFLTTLRQKLMSKI